MFGVENKIVLVIIMFIAVKFLYNGRGRLKVFHRRGSRYVCLLSVPCAMGRGVTHNKREGDLNTPLGVFRFLCAFGTDKNPGAKIKYVELSDTMYWVDDTESKYYNRLVDLSAAERDFKSAEHMTAFPGAYDYGLATSFNKNCVPGRGSAVFMHCTEDLCCPTHGCIAVKKPIMREIIKAVTANSVIAVFK